MWDFFENHLDLSKETVLKLSGLWLVWRIGITIVAWLSNVWLPFTPTYPYAQEILKSPLPDFLVKHAGFDGVHYWNIVQYGYESSSSGLIQAFFPVYPLILDALHSIGIPVILAGVVLSSIAFWGVLLVFYSEVRHYFTSKVAWYSTLALTFFPTSFYFGMVYTESLFLLLVLLTLRWSRQDQWWWAAGAAAIASGTRIVGVILVPAMFFQLLQREVSTPAGITGLLPSIMQRIITIGTWLRGIYRLITKRRAELFAILMGSMGLVLYMSYLDHAFDDPLRFLSVQEEFGGGRSESLVLYPQVIWRYLKILFTAELPWQTWLSFSQEFAAGTLGLLAIVWNWRRIPWSWMVFALGAFLVPTLTGTFSSLSRYVLVCLPLFVTLGIVTTENRWWRWGWLSLSSTLLIINLALFISGIWVA